MNTPPKSLHFAIVTELEGAEDAKNQLFDVEGTSEKVLQNIQGFWYNMAQQVKMSAEETRRQISELTRTVELAGKVMAETPATKVTFDTGEIKLVVKDLEKPNFAVTELRENLRNLQAQFAQATAFQPFVQGFDALTASFIGAHPELAKVNKELIANSQSLRVAGVGMKEAKQHVDELIATLGRMKVAAAPVEYKFKIDPEVVVHLRNLRESIVPLISEARAAEDDILRFAKVIGILHNATQTAASEGLDPLVSEFRELEQAVAEQTAFIKLATDLSTAVEAARSSVEPFAVLRSKIDEVTQSGILSTEKLAPLAASFDRLGTIVKEREKYTLFAQSMREVANAPDVTNVEEMREKVGELINTARQFNLDSLIGPLESLHDEMSKGGGKVSEYQGSIRKLADTSDAKAGINSILNEINRLANELRVRGVDVDSMVKSLHQLVVSPATVESLDAAQRQVSKLALSTSAAYRKDVADFASTIDVMGERITNATRSTTGLVEGIEKIRTTTPIKPIELARVEPQAQQQIAQIGRDLIVSIESATQAVSASERLALTFGAIENAAKAAVQNGLDPLEERFKAILPTLQKQTVLNEFSENLTTIAQAALASDQPFTVLEADLDNLANSTLLASESMDPFRENIRALIEQIRQREVLVDFTDKLQQLGKAPDITSMRQMRNEVDNLLQGARQTKGLENIVPVLESLSKEMQKGGGHISQFKGKLVQIAETGKEQIGLKSIVTEIEKLALQTGDAGGDIDSLLKSLHQFGLGVTTSATNTANASKQLSSLAQTAGTNARKAINSLNNEFEQSTKKLSGVTQSVGGLRQKLGQLAFGVGGLNRLFGDWQVKMSQALISFGVVGIARHVLQDFKNVVEATAKTIFKLAESAAKVSDVETAFSRLASTAGDANTILAQIRQSAGGVIDRMELVGSATRAALAGLPVERFAEVVEGARALAAVTGREAPEALERLTNAMAKQERRLLDELGIVVRANDIYADYAEKHHTTAAAMTASQKQAAFFEATMAAVNEKMLRLGGTIDLAQRPFLELKASWKDLGITAGQFLDRTFGVSSIVKGLADSLKDLSSSFSTARDRTAMATAEYLNAAKAVENYEKVIPGLISEAAKLKDSIQSASVTVVEKEEADKRLKEITEILIALFPQLADILGTDLTKGLEKANEATKKLANTQRTLATIELLKSMKEASKAFEEANKTISASELIYGALNKVTISLAEGKEALSQLTREERMALNDLISRKTLFLEGVGAEILTLEYANELRTEAAEKYGKNRIAINAMNSLLVTSIKTQIELGRVTKEEVAALISAKVGTTEYSNALSNLLVKVGGTAEMYDSARQSLALLVASLIDAPKSAILSGKLLTDAITGIVNEWQALAKTIDETGLPIDSTDIQKAQAEFDLLQTKENDLYWSTIKNMGGVEVINREALQKMVAEWRESNDERVRIGKIQGEDERKKAQEALDQSEKRRKTATARYRVEDELLRMLAETERATATKSIELKEKEIDTKIKIAENELAKSIETTDSKIQQAEKEHSFWLSMQKKYEIGAETRGKLAEFINDREAKAAKTLTLAQRDELTKRTKDQLDIQLRAIETFAGVIPKLIGISSDQAISVLETLKGEVDNLPPEFSTLANKTISELKRLADEQGNIGKETINEIGSTFATQLDLEREKISQLTEDDVAYLDASKKARKIAVDFALKAGTLELESKQRENKILQGMAQSRTKVLGAENIKQVEDAKKNVAKIIKENILFIEDRQRINRELETLNRLSSEQITSFYEENTRKMLRKVSEAKTFVQIKDIETETKAAEIGMTNLLEIEEAKNQKLRELMDEHLGDIMDYTAKRNQVEEIAQIERIKQEEKAITEKIDLLEIEMRERGTILEYLDKLNEARLLNETYTNEKIRDVHEKLARETELGRLKYQKRTEANELAAAKSRIEIDTITTSNILNNNRNAWQMAATLAKEGSQEQIDALKHVTEIDALLKLIQAQKTNALANAEIEAAQKSAKERAKIYNDLAKYIGNTAFSINIVQRQALVEERDLYLRQIDELEMRNREAIAEKLGSGAAAREEIKRSEEYYNSLLVQVQRTFNIQILGLERELWRAKIEAAIWGNSELLYEIERGLQAIGTMTSDETAKTIDTMIKLYEQGKETISAAMVAIAVPSATSIVAAAASGLELVSTIVNEYRRRQAEKEKKAAERVSETIGRARYLSELEAIKKSIDLYKWSVEQREKLEEEFSDKVESISAELADSMAREMSEAITSGLDVPFDELVRNFVKAKVAEKIANVIENKIKTPLDELARITEMTVDPDAWGGEWTKIYHQKTRQFQKKLEKAGIDPLIIADIIAAGEAAIRAATEAEMKMEYGSDAMARQFVKIKGTWDALEPTVMEAVESVRGFMGGLDDEISDLEEQIPTATFRAVTEPQANQMIVLLGRQTDLLSQIANNTAMLKQPVANMPIPLAAAPALTAGEQRININERFEIIINHDMTAKLNRLEDLDTTFLANIIAQKQQLMIDQREMALGRNRLSNVRTR